MGSELSGDVQLDFVSGVRERKDIAANERQVRVRNWANTIFGWTCEAVSIQESGLERQQGALNVGLSIETLTGIVANDVLARQ